MKIFMLDDDVYRRETTANDLAGHELTFATSVQDAHLFNPPYDVVMLDHDLGFEGGTGTEFISNIATKLDNETRDFTAFIVHSWNPKGAESMKAQLEKLGCYVELAPYKQFKWNQWIDKLQTMKQE